MEEKKKDHKMKGCLKSSIILIVLITIIILLVFFCWCQKEDENNDKVILDKESIQFDGTYEGDGTVNLYQTEMDSVKVLENLEFGDYNEERLLKIKIKAEEEYIYESDYLKPEEVLKEDIIQASDIEKIGGSVIAEIYSFTEEKELIGQTNVVIKTGNK